MSQYPPGYCGVPCNTCGYMCSTHDRIGFNTCTQYIIPQDDVVAEQKRRRDEGLSWLEILGPPKKRPFLQVIK